MPQNNNKTNNSYYCTVSGRKVATAAQSGAPCKTARAGEKKGLGAVSGTGNVAARKKHNCK